MHLHLHCSCNGIKIKVEGEPFKMQLNPLTPLSSLGMTRNTKLIAQDDDVPLAVPCKMYRTWEMETPQIAQDICNHDEPEPPAKSNPSESKWKRYQGVVSPKFNLQSESERLQKPAKCTAN